jgi:hypothetical protein
VCPCGAFLCAIARPCGGFCVHRGTRTPSSGDES